MSGSAARGLEQPDGRPILEVTGATLRFGERTLWSDLDFRLEAGEYVAVLGSNGTGKSSLFRALLGQLRLTSGSVSFLGEPARRGDRRIGYIPQRLEATSAAPVRGQDLVALGLSGHRFGLPWPSRRRRVAVRQALEQVGGTSLARRPLELLSGGEQQRLRIAQALVDRPRLLLCDEPFAGLDLARQREMSELIDAGRRATNCGVLLITHDINPVLSAVDRVIYLANGQARVGSVEEVFTGQGLSAMYDTPVEVIRTRGRIIVVGATGVADTDPALTESTSH